MKSGTLRSFWAKITIEDNGCWRWKACIIRVGYGLFYNGKKAVLAHRWSYQKFIGKIPDGLVIDHLCRNRWCVNPNHLQPVTMRENILRGVGLAAINAKKTHCIRGHPFSGNNLGKQQRGRRCLTCRAMEK